VWLGVACLGTVLLVGCGGGDATQRPVHPQWLRAVDRGGESGYQVPLIALNCPVGNGFRCDRIVFAYTLALPASRFEAWVAGRPVKGLRTAPYGEDGPHEGETGITWTGFVQPAGMAEPGAPHELTPSKPDYWAGRPPVRARVRVVAHLKSGETVSELFPFVNLQAGYG
jgi:hypothetical protein